MVNRIYKKVKSTLFSDPELLYKEERNLVNKPFYFPGNNKKAVLLIHGWTSTPYEVRRLGTYLNENGYTTYGPQLKGHGTVPKDLENVKWTDWLRDAEKAYDELKKDHEKVYVAGTSIGSCISIIFAQKRKDIAGLILMATPYKLKFEKIAGFFLRIMIFLRINYKKKHYPPTYGASTTITRVISYQTYSLKSALEIFNLVKIARKNLIKIGQPCFVIQSLSDHVVAKKSLERIHDKVGSKIKKKKYIKRAYHTFISDIKNEGVFEDILDFIKKN